MAGFSLFTSVDIDDEILSAGLVQQAAREPGGCGGPAHSHWRDRLGRGFSILNSVREGLLSRDGLSHHLPLTCRDPRQAFR